MKMKPFVIAGILCLSMSSSAMVIRHDVAEHKYLVSEKDFPAVFPLFEQDGRKECVATLISNKWAVTAAHCTVLLGDLSTADLNHKVVVAGQANQITSVVIPPEYGDLKPIFNKSQQLIDIQGIKDESFDIALLKLAKPINDVEPVTFYQQQDEVGKQIMLLGWGDFTDGKQGLLSESTKNDGKFRKATNVINGIAGNYLIFDFDSPDSNTSLPLEGVAGPGDSGGPALVRSGENWKIIGISSGGAYPDELAASKAADGQYGWREFYVRTSQMKAWIQKVIKN